MKVQKMAILLLCILCQGCVTVLTWENTGRKMWPHKVKGFEKINSASDIDQPEILLVTYGAESKWPRDPVEYTYLIPRKDGSRSNFFIYEGSQRKFKAILNEIPSDPIRLNRTMRFSNDTTVSGEFDYRGEIFRESNIVISIDTRRDEDRGIVLMPFFQKEDDVSVSSKGWVYDVDYSDVLLVPYCKLLIIPGPISKKPFDHFVDLALATIETPFAVVADVILLPIEIIAILNWPV